MRFVGLDYGKKRIGISVSDSEGRLALPVCSFERTKDLPGDLRRLSRIINEYEPAALIVGMPIGLSGKTGSSSDAVEQFLTELLKLVHVEVYFQDERFSTQEASRLLQEAKFSAKEQRSIIDASAAAIILQAWLDGRVSGIK